MSKDIDNNINKFEELSALIGDVDSKSDTAAETLVDESTTVSNTAENVEIESTVENTTVEEVNVDEKSADEALIAEKASSIMARMASTEVEKPVVFLSDTRFKEMIQSGELLPTGEYDSLDEDAKSAYEEVDVMEEGTGKGYGMHWRRRSPMELNAMRKQGKGVKAEDADMDEDMFDSEDQALERAAALGCSGTHMAGDKFMPCATHDDWMKLARSAKPTEEGMGAMAGAEMGKSADSFLCGMQRKSVEQPCNFCKGGCQPEDGLPGLAEIETMVKSAYSGSTVLSSGYSTDDDLFVVDVKRADGSFIEVFMSGDGEELGWLRIDGNAFDEKDGEPVHIISKSDAEVAAMDSLTELGVKSGEVLSIMVDVFNNEDVYVVEIDSDEKSYDFFVGVTGKVLGYDEYEYESDYSMTEEEEIKALEAELEIKRMYSREQRESMAESGEAMPDGSFPIADAADLENAIMAHGRAADVEAAKAHIMKRAKELGMEDMIPADWMSGGNAEEAPMGKDALDSAVLNDLKEFQRMMEEGNS